MNIEHLYMSFGLQEIFNDVSVHFNDDDKIGIVGVNGAGKSTLFNLILGNISPDSGKITVKNRDLIGYLPQVITDEIPNDDITVFEYLLLGRPIQKLKDNITSLYEQIAVEKDDYAKKIYNESNNVLNDINEVFNVSSIDNSKVKIVDTTFNIYNLYDEIIYIIKNKINENTNFKYSITDTIPRLLYGDNVRIKQIIVALLLNSISDKEGIIDLDIYEIVKNDICRLVIIVQSSYIKLDLNEINNILNSNVNITNDLEKYDISLKDVKKLIDVIGGTLLINDNDGIMNFKIIINEKIKTKKDADNLDLIANKLTNKKRVLLASDDYLELSTFTNILKNNNFTVDTVMYYKDITSKLNEKNKYDLLIIDDEMNDESAVSIIKEINKLKINHIIKIVLLDNDKELIKKHYLENNIFDDYIFKSNFKEDLKKVTTKYK